MFTFDFIQNFCLDQCINKTKTSFFWVDIERLFIETPVFIYISIYISYIIIINNYNHANYMYFCFLPFCCFKTLYHISLWKVAYFCGQYITVNIYREMQCIVTKKTFSWIIQRPFFAIKLINYIALDSHIKILK